MNFRMPDLKNIYDRRKKGGSGKTGDRPDGMPEIDGSSFFREPAEDPFENLPEEGQPDREGGVSFSDAGAGMGQGMTGQEAGGGERRPAGKGPFMDGMTGPEAGGGEGRGWEGPEEAGRDLDGDARTGWAGTAGSGPVRNAQVQKKAGTVMGMLKGYGIWAAIVLVVCLLLELFFFNHDHWHTPRGGELTMKVIGSASGKNAGESSEDQGDPEGGSGDRGQGTFTVTLGSGLEQTEYGTFLVTDPEKAYLNLRDINAEVENLYLNIVDPDTPEVFYSIRYTDSANAELRRLHDRMVVSGVPESRYVRLHFKGITRNMRIYLETEEGKEFHIRQIRLNVKEPLFFHLGRVLLLWLAGMLLVVFGPRSWIYTTRLDLKEGRQRLLVVAIVAVNIIATCAATKAADPAVWREQRDERDYQEKEYELYAEALLKGHTWLDIRPPRYLTRLRNPYDRLQRDAMAHQYSEKVLWDAAYYNGRYYVYFGIVPALISFVPHRLITGQALPTWKAVQTMAVLLWILSFYFIYVIIRKYFRRTSLGVYLLLAEAFVPAAGVIYLVTFPVVYSVPFIYGLVFTVAGLSLWLRGFDRKGNPHRLRMVIGSLCIALTLGCRPTMILTAVLAFPIFWDQIREKKFFYPKKDSLLNTAAVILPFIPVGLLQMQLNSSRFGSPFDFGADYNLTVSDLTKKTFSIAKNIPALFQELFQPMHIEPQFPFITGIEVSTDYQGYMFIDKMIGGFFALNMLALFCFWIFRIRKKMMSQKVFGLAAFSFGLAAVLIELDVQIGGISQRYMIDYGWLLMLAAILAILTILETTDRHGYYAYLKAILVLTVLCVAVNYLSVFSDGQAISVRTFNPALFYRIKYLISPS